MRKPPISSGDSGSSCSFGAGLMVSASSSSSVTALSAAVSLSLSFKSLSLVLWSAIFCLSMLIEKKGPSVEIYKFVGVGSVLRDWASGQH